MSRIVVVLFLNYSRCTAGLSGGDADTSKNLAEATVN